jgi:UDP-N-acetylglucosamine diphosphorylase / glucose-1-phosphate thymidylyltransferase / UDP-N-acetylgalactosamine diphosphorylase / glucosamine-1-phosphate N-acetyltransferase / galactosamine-1-phosphate N-acetyltransferase
MIGHPWDLLECNAEALDQDYLHWAGTRDRQAALGGATVIGPPERVLVDPAARVEPLVIIDTTQGPVLIDRGAVVRSFTRLEGPCYIGPDTQVFGGRVAGSSIGPNCRVAGEVEESIVHGFSNKRHDGFLGHSYVGEWVNLGAGTQTSDLRNDYGKVVMKAPGAKRETGRTKVGAFIGDHTRTSIGTLLNTGTIVGPFCQLLAWGSLMPRYIPAFTRIDHGQLRERTDLREIMTTAAVVMARRGELWTEALEDLFFALYEQTAAQRRQLVWEPRARATPAQGTTPAASHAVGAPWLVSAGR